MIKERLADLSYVQTEEKPGRGGEELPGFIL